VEVLAGNTVMYRQLSFVKYVEPESKKWQFRADWCAIAGLGICLFGESYVEYYNLRELLKSFQLSLLTSVTHAPTSTSPAPFLLPCSFSNLLCYAYNFTA
jgi:hypothetical protein